MTKNNRLPKSQNSINTLIKLLRSVDLNAPDAKLNSISMKTKKGRIAY